MTMASLRALEAFLGCVDYEGSTMGPLLDRLELYSDRYHEIPHRPKVASARFMPKEKQTKALPKFCQRCGDALAHETCGHCNWSYVLDDYRLTANITGETHTSKADPPDAERLVSYARTSRLFKAFEKANPRFAFVLAVYYGVESRRYDESAYDPYRRLLSIMPMTPAGDEIVQKVLAKKLNAADTDAERIRMFAAQHKASPDVSKASAQATKLHRRALELWYALDADERRSRASQ